MMWEKYLSARTLPSHRWRWPDDTAMAVSIMEVLGRHGKIDQDDLAETISKNLQTFDTLDYTVFTNQQWTRLHESHAKDILVHWPDGHTTSGIEKHIEDLKDNKENTKLRELLLRTESLRHDVKNGICKSEFICSS